MRTAGWCALIGGLVLAAGALTIGSAAALLLRL